MKAAGPIERETQGLCLALTDVVIAVMGAAGLVFLLVAARWAPGSGWSLGIFGVVAMGAPLLRAFSRLMPRVAGFFDFAASFWLLPAAVLGHEGLGPIADAVRPVLMDRQLVRADLALFGANPAVYLDGRSPPWLTELLYLCYYSYYLWPLVVAALLYASSRRAFEEFTLALSLCLAASFLAYVQVPAVGPRFFLAGFFSGPLQGVRLTPMLDSLMRLPRFLRDSFPSGHTAVTIIVLTYAFRFRRWLFWVVLPLSLGLVAGTVVCRFHYAVDVIAAVPLAAIVLLATAALERTRHRGVLVVRAAVRAARPPGRR